MPLMPFCATTATQHIPFGGVQMLLHRDLFLGAPVANREGSKYWRVLQKPFFFLMRWWYACKTVRQSNSKIYRQTDETFIHTEQITSITGVQNRPGWTAQTLSARLRPPWKHLTPHNAKSRCQNQQKSWTTCPANSILLEGTVKGRFPI